MNKTTAKELQENISILSEKLENLGKKFMEYEKNIEKRDYLIKTKFKGEIKNKKLLNELQAKTFSSSTNYPDIYKYWNNPKTCDYKEACERINNFHFDEINSLYNSIMEYNERQRILDKYDEQKIKK